MKNIVDFYQPWPQPSAEFAAQMREVKLRERERFEANFRSIDEAPRDGTEIMVALIKSVMSWNSWRAKWDEAQGCWLRGWGDDWFRITVEPRYWLHKEKVRDAPPFLIRVGPSIELNLTA